MKKLLFTLSIELLLFSALCQGQINWVSSEPGPKNLYCRLIGPAGEKSRTVFIAAPGFWPYIAYFKKEDINLRKYSENLSSFEPLAVPGEFPSCLKAYNFGDYIVVSGGYYKNPEAKGPAKGSIIEQKILFYDSGMTLMREMVFDSKHKGENFFNPVPFVYISPDQKLLVCVSKELIQDPKTHMYSGALIHVKVINDELDVLLEKIIGPKDVEITGEIPNYELDWIDDKVLLSFGGKNNDSEYVLEVAGLEGENEEGTFDIIKTFKNYEIGYTHIYKDQNLVLVGCKTGLRNQYLFHYSKNPYENQELQCKEWEMDEAFCMKYGLNPKEKLSPPSRMFILSDGFLVFCEQVTVVDEKKATSENIGFIKFDFDGKILWYKTIDKSAKGPSKDAVKSKCFINQDELVVFYADNPENVQNNSGKVIAGESPSNLGLVVAVISASGTLTKKTLNANQETSVAADIQSIYKDTDGSYILSGSNIVTSDKKIYIGRIEL